MIFFYHYQLNPMNIFHLNGALRLDAATRHSDVTEGQITTENLFDPLFVLSADVSVKILETRTSGTYGPLVLE